MKKHLKRTLILLLSVIVLGFVLLGGYAVYGKIQMGKIPSLSYEDALQYTLKDTKEAVITVGVIKDGVSSFTVYGKNGAELPKKEHAYEIGSVTKTFTAALIQKAISEGKIKIGETLSDYLTLPAEMKYPTILQLITHTSCYEGYYFETPMIGNFLKGRNDFYGITDQMVLDRLSKLSVSAERYPFAYSNFGYAVLGLVLEAVYEEDYTVLVNRYVQDELGLKSTHISDQTGDLPGGWSWEKTDTYLSAGGLTSTITDMLSYAALQLDTSGTFSENHMSLAEIDTNSSSNKTMGIYIDEIGMGWIIDKRNEIIWHNGATGGFNCYIGFRPQDRTAVVILSNLSPKEKIPATVLGIKLLSEMRN